MKIDTHIHVTPPEMIRDWKRVAEKEPYFRLLSESPINRFATAEDVVAALDRDHFDKGVIFGFGFRDMGRCREVNDYVMEKVKAFPDRLIGFASVVPQHPEAERELLRCYEGGLRGVGELFPEGQSFAPESASEMRILGAFCTEHRMPVLIHVNEPVGHFYPGKTSTTLRQAECFAENFPDLPIILAHWGGGLFFYELMREMSATLSNVYYDTAASVFLYGHKVFDVVKTLGLADKVFFGSDFPLLPPRRYMKDLKASGLSDEEKHAILGGNAERVFRKLGILL